MHSSMGSMSCYGLGNAVDITQLAVQQSISAMWNRHGEQLSLDELADCAILSKFYFSRVFRSATGTSPGRFLTAIRLFKTKNLLLETSLHVTDIAYRVGYQPSARPCGSTCAPSVARRSMVYRRPAP